MVIGDQSFVRMDQVNGELEEKNSNASMVRRRRTCEVNRTCCTFLVF
jgi:hypothetical protein